MKELLMWRHREYKNMKERHTEKGKKKDKNKKYIYIKLKPKSLFMLPPTPSIHRQEEIGI